LNTAASRRKRADIAGSAGAGVLGVGLGALLAEWAAPYAAFLVIVGVLFHGWGMLEKHRLESKAAMPRWASILYWLCWITLAALVAGVGFRAFRG
jgi:hypothetical protein